MRIVSLLLLAVLSIPLLAPGCAGIKVKPGPAEVPCFDVYEVELRLKPEPDINPFTDIQVTALFTPEEGDPIPVEGFCDDQEGRVFRVRFSPSIAGTRYRFSVKCNTSPDWEYRGSFRTTEPAGMEPVIVNPVNPKHFVFARSHRPFYHLGITAYHLLDPTNDEGKIEEFLDYCVENGFNKVRFLLTGYPRDTDTRSKSEYTPGAGDQWKMPNYGAPPGEVNPLPAWPGEPHHYDFTRFNVAYWRKADRAVRAMRDRGIVATCIITIEKQGLPDEYGALTADEKRLYRYAVNRLAAFSNVWWDLGNEHNEYRKPEWAPVMGSLVKKWDPYDRLCSAHAYADWIYDNQSWADYIITQQYGDCFQVNRWALKYRDIPKPYVNEEYGYEGVLDKPGHGQNTDLVRKCHWGIALAGGYATYGDWTPGTAFYTGEIGRGQAPPQLHFLRETFESLPFQSLKPRNELVGNGSLCLAKPGEIYLVYLPNGGRTTLRVEPRTKGYRVEWLDTRAGKRVKTTTGRGNRITLQAPGKGDWAVLVTAVE